MWDKGLQESLAMATNCEARDHPLNLM